MRWTAATTVAALAVAVALALGAWIWKGASLAGKPAAPAEIAANVTLAGEAAPEASAAASVRGARRRAEVGPLPPLEMPLRLALQQLERRAAAGEPKAACRLAAELAYCERLRVDLAAAEQTIEQAQTEQQPRSAAAVESAEVRSHRTRWMEMTRARAEGVLREAAHCEGVRTALPATIAHHWRAAALGGHVPSMTHYAVGNAFRIRDTLNNLPALAIYRQEAEAIARRAAAAGDVNAMAVLAAAYSPLNDDSHRTYLAQSVRPDVVESLSLYLQLRAGAPNAIDPRTRLIEAKIVQLSQIASPPQLAQAKSRAAQHRPIALGALSARTVLGGGLPDVPREHCDGDGSSEASTALGSRSG